jgi:hypothetical protein
MVEKLLTEYKTNIMSTKALIRFAERESGVSFNEHPEKVTHQIYHHYDGYPEFLGVALAEFISDESKSKYDNPNRHYNGADDLAAQVLTYLKLGIPYNRHDIDAYSVYLETPYSGKVYYDYTYYIWTKDETNEVWLSVFDFDNECIFVGQPSNLIDKYKDK